MEPHDEHGLEEFHEQATRKAGSIFRVHTAIIQGWGCPAATALGKRTPSEKEKAKGDLGHSGKRAARPQVLWQQVPGPLVAVADSV